MAGFFSTIPMPLPPGNLQDDHTTPMLTGDQIYIAQLANLHLTVTSGNNGAPDDLKWEICVIFNKGETFQTSGNDEKRVCY